MNPPSDAQTISVSLDALVAAKPPSLHHFRLENGLSVYLCENHTAPLVAVQLWYHVGSSDEPPGHSNLSHLLEHLIFQGSSKLPSGQYSRLIAQLGGRANASTYDDSTAFEMTLPAERLPVALELMADAMTGASFGQSEFELEVLTVDAERRFNVDHSALDWAKERHRKLAYDGTPYAAPIFGHAIDLAQTDLETVRTWYRTWYHPNNATLVVVGAASLQDLRRHVDTYFAPLSPAPLWDRPLIRYSATLQARSQQLVDPRLEDGLLMSFNVPSLASAPSQEVALALLMLESILGTESNALLYRRLSRDRPVLTSSKATYDYQMRGDALVGIEATLAANTLTAQEAALEIWNLIDELRTTALPDEVLEREKLRLLARELYAQADIDKQATRIGHAAAAGLDPASLAEAPRIIRNLSSSTLQQVAARYLHRDRLTTTYLQRGEPV
ncbi:M16 family metallopeptidase [Pseudomonas sp. NY15372]|uniref:M16 family metallopeptidase n=1 Tax=Pseudomonas sp. NY15372 TaxID=3400356 RepID=UPI003A8C50E6